MKHPYSIALCLLLSVAAFADSESLLRDGGALAALQFTGNGTDTDVPKVYIVQLRSPSAAEYVTSGVRGVSGKVSAPRSFDKNSALVQGYTQKLADEQQRVLAKAGPGAQQIYSYRYSLNGFAARMTAAEAIKVEHMPEVLRVWEDEIRPLTTNFSAEFLDLFDSENGLRGVAGLDGDGIVIGVIDSGIAPEHPALADTRSAPMPRLCESTWAQNSLLGKWLCRRFERMADITLFEPPENWNGVCQAGPEFPADACNNKMIGARYFFDGAADAGPIDDGEIFSALDVDGHGTHTATTAAGNRVDASIFGTVLGRVEGMAPKARIAAYKACWLRPDETRSSCNTSDLALAIDTAVADGIHIINYSVGNSMRDTTAPDDVALMAAAKAGVLTIVAAGNEGPNFATIGSPAGSPWVITAGASSRDGAHSLEAISITEPASVAGRYAVREASFTTPLADAGPIEADLVLADDDDNLLANGDPGTTFDACEPLVNDTDISGNIAFIQRGGCSFQVKVTNAEDAGAVAAVIFSIAGDPIVMVGTAGSVDIPALMLGQADGNLILAELDAGETVSAVLDKGLFLTVEDTGNVMGSFSSRGPAPIQDILKPDVTAPGINILAGFTPHAVNSLSGENFAFLTGTSMSTPHVAGIAALLKQAHPDWSPAALKSALMTTAYQDVRLQNSESLAIPLDFGAGHIAPNAANDPGLVFDVTDDEFDAYTCGIDSPAIDEQRCTELLASGLSSDASQLNQPSITVARLANSKTVTRRVTNVSDTSEAYMAEIVPPAGIDVTVSPMSLSVLPGASVEFDVTYTYASGPLDAWRFGSLTWNSDDHAVRSVLAARPISLTAPGEVVSTGTSSDLTFPVEFGYNGTYSAGVHGLRRPLIIRDTVDSDPTKTFTIRETNGVTAHLYDVPANQAYLRFALFDEFTDGNDDLDMYVYYCPDGVNCNKIGESGGQTAEEEFNVLLPGAGTYAVFVHGFATDNVTGGPGAVYDIYAWQFGLNDNQGNMSVTAPAAVSSGSTEDILVSWSGLQSDSIYLGGISHTTPQGLVGLTVIRIRN
ncbi:MAG: S8 family serine peptidase [Woeseia sp.]